MSKINFVFGVLLLISSCGKHDFYSSVQGSKNRVKREISEEDKTGEIQQTPEEVLRERLNDSQRKGLDFLKDALNDKNKLNNILSLDESKIKSTLEHIHSEVVSCTGDDSEQKKETFKTSVREYFKGSGGYDLGNVFGDNSQLTSTCRVVY
ncbi:Mlp family lipoprotein [Borrelia coriaceae]|nr:Mlp family lipoprotein [Borrelia coriaceae]